MSKSIRGDVKLVEPKSPNLMPERDANKPPVLEATNLGIDFGGLTAVDDFNIALGRTEISGLIGPNGAGKTTVFNLLTKPGVVVRIRGERFFLGDVSQCGRRVFHSEFAV